MDTTVSTNLNFYFNTLTEEFPRYDGDLELLGWRFGEDLPDNWVVVINDGLPSITKLQTYEMELPIVIDNVWHSNFSIRDKTEQELTLEIETENRIKERFKADTLVM